MSKFLYRLTLASSIALGSFIGSSGKAIASEIPVLPDTTAQNITSVSQLSDVKSTDWAFTALQSLVERYGCIAGYPDRTFKGQRAMTRYEFAAGLNACLDKINELISSGLADKVSKADLAALQKLQEEFAAELATLRGRVDALEAKTAKLEAQQFSTTTKLYGEAIFALTDSFGGKNITDITNTSVNGDRSNLVFQNRIRLNFISSFSGSDRLRVRLQAGNAVPILSSGGNTTGPNAAALLFSNDGRLNYDDSSVATSNNSIFLDLLDYSFPIGDKAKLSIFANGGYHYHYADTINPYLEDYAGGNGAISRFAERNPIYGIGGNAAGLGFSYKFADAFKLDLGYLANRASTPTEDNGLFGGNYSALAQLVIQPGDRFKLGLTYVHGYNSTNTFRFGGSGTGTGTFLASLIPLALSSSTGLPVANFNSPISSNSYGLEASWQISPGFVLGGWAGFTAARIHGFGDADIWNYAVTLAFPDLFKEGNLGGIIVGAEPSLKGLRASNGSQVNLTNRDDALHIETFYKYRLTNNLSITPGLIWLPAINQRSSNDDVFIGTVRTTFTF